MTELKTFKFTHWIRYGEEYKTEDVITNRLGFLDTHVILCGVPIRKMAKWRLAYLENELGARADEHLEFYRDHRGDYLVVANLYDRCPLTKADRLSRGWMESPPLFHSDASSFVFRFPSRPSRVH